MNHEEIQQFVEDHLQEELTDKEQMLYQLIFEDLAKEDPELTLSINLATEVITKIEIQENKKENIKHIFMIAIALLAGICLFLAGAAIVKVSLLFYLWGLLKTYSMIIIFIALSLTIIQFSNFADKKQSLS